jgi:hypothetical protein
MEHIRVLDEGIRYKTDQNPEFYSQQGQRIY